MFNFFRRKKSKSDAVIEIYDELVSAAETKWLEYNDVMKFKDNVALKDIVTSFLMIIDEALRKNYKQLEDAPDEVIILIVINGILKSGTHTVEELDSVYLGLTSVAKP
jgi:hypothetical protein